MNIVLNCYTNISQNSLISIALPPPSVVAIHVIVRFRGMLITYAQLVVYFANHFAAAPDF